MTAEEKDFQKLFELSKHARILQGIASLLDWDQETYMPSGSAPMRAEQLKTMAGLIHREKTSRKYTNALGNLIDLTTGKMIAQDLNPNQNAALREWRRDYLHDTALPSKFVEEFAQVTAQAVTVWREAKRDNSFLHFAPFLDRIVMLNRKKADLIGYQEHPYDALIDEFEADVKTADVEALFTKLRHHLAPLINRIGQRSVEDKFLFGQWDQAKQLAFSDKVLDAMGYDKDKGRLDLSTHPFSSASHPTDSRITTRIHPTAFMSNILAVLHEAGHALYEMGLPQNEYGSPLGEARSLGIHESQSRWWETRIGLSRPFWQHFLPLLKETFPVKLDPISLDVFYRAINKVKPSLIRIEADELTYPMHIILRFELEKSLIEGSLSIRDLPEAWNAKMKEYLGVVPGTNSEGCLQDIHWSIGAFGYFPTYTLGNLYAAHLFEGFAKDHPEWEKSVAAGEFEFIKKWLSDKIYQHGRRYPTQELLKRATGHSFSADSYLTYLKKKYETL